LFQFALNKEEEAANPRKDYEGNARRNKDSKTQRPKTQFLESRGLEKGRIIIRTMKVDPLSWKVEEYHLVISVANQVTLNHHVALRTKPWILIRKILRT
jgi:hypothetical protein